MARTIRKAASTDDRDPAQLEDPVPLHTAQPSGEQDVNMVERRGTDHDETQDEEHPDESPAIDGGESGARPRATPPNRARADQGDRQDESDLELATLRVQVPSPDHVPADLRGQALEVELLVDPQRHHQAGEDQPEDRWPRAGSSRAVGHGLAPGGPVTTERPRRGRPPPSPSPSRSGRRYRVSSVRLPPRPAEAASRSSSLLRVLATVGSRDSRYSRSDRLGCNGGSGWRIPVQESDILHRSR